MLTPAKSLTAQQDGLTVFFKYDPRPIVATLARLVRAYNPYGAVPPSEVPLTTLASVAATDAEITRLNTALADMGRTFTADGASRDKAVSDIAGNLRTMVGWLMAAGLTTPRMDHLFSPTLLAQPPGAQAALAPNLGDAGKALSLLADRDRGGWLNADEVTALCLVTLRASYEKLVAANSLLTEDEKAPEGASRETWSAAMRVRKLITLGIVLRQSIELAPLRERAALFSSAAFAPLLDYALPQTRDLARDYATQILNIKVHPWIAEAERLRLPAKRYTEWSPGSTTMGLTPGEDGTWDALAGYAIDRTGAVPDKSTSPRAGDLRDILLADYEVSPTIKNPVHLADFITRARSFLMSRAMLNQGEIQRAETLLGLTAPTSPPQVHLHGDTWKAIVMTGSGASAPVADIQQLLLSPRVPLKLPNGSYIAAGQTDALQYVARVWVTGLNGTTLTPHDLLQFEGQTPPLFVEPQRPDLDAAFGLRQIAPSMLRPVTPREYWGDEGAIMDDYSVDGAARLLGFASAASMLSSPAALRALTASLFKADTNGKLVPAVSGASQLFYSPRTMQHWRTRVEIPADAIPTMTLAFDARTVPQLGDIQATIVRTPEVPPMVSATMPTADAAAAAAAKGLGVTA